jgi:hypothetical protein
LPIVQTTGAPAPLSRAAEQPGTGRRRPEPLIQLVQLHGALRLDDAVEQLAEGFALVDVEPGQRHAATGDPTVAGQLGVGGCPERT